VASDAEITLEANPGTAESRRFSRYREIGLTRLSIGIQSFNPDLLKKIGRVHDDQEAIAAVEMARAAGFRELNLDLMFGLPGQTEALALVDVDTAIELQPTHLSFYQLTLEPNTVFHKYPPILPQEEDTWRIQELGQSRFVEPGLFNMRFQPMPKRVHVVATILIIGHLAITSASGRAHMAK